MVGFDAGFGWELSQGQNTCAYPLYVVWVAHSMESESRATKGYTHVHSHFCHILSLALPQGLSIFNGVKKQALVT